VKALRIARIRSGSVRKDRVRNGRVGQGDAGSAVIEFVFVAVLVMVPLVYLIVAVATVQRSSLAVTNAAREAGRAFATAESTTQALARANLAAQLAERDQGLPGNAELRYVTAGAGCDSAPIQPELAAGAVFGICVRNSVQLPGVPSLISGRGVTTIGEYTVHVDDFRSTR
jgi:hypothetical protein